MHKKRCLYCGKSIINGNTCCNNKCKDDYANFEKTTSKYSSYFWCLTIISLIAAFVGKLLTVSNEMFGSVVSNLGVLVFFITLMIFPFSTPMIVEYLGVKKAKFIVRVIALVCIICFLISILF